MGLELSRLIDALPGLVWTALPDGRAEFLNQRWCEYTGLSLEQAIGYGWQSALHPDDPARTLKSWRSFLESGRPGEARLRRHDGEYRRFIMSAAPIADEAGRIVQWCGINTDIEDRLKAEESVHARESQVAEAALNKARADLTHMARVMTLGALTASIAHEVNQPLSGIITNASTCLRMLAADPPNLDGARATAQRTLRDGNRASEVIQRLRTLFTRKQPTTEPVDLNDAAREVLALSSSELRGNRVIPQTDFDEGLPAIKGDRVQLQQVILNLILNAADAMGEIDDRPRNLLVATACEAANRIRLSVRDSGVGIDPQRLEKLFDAFYTTKSQGMGIGLSISRSIIESHEGRLWATANDGPGATFLFSIPCRSESAPGPVGHWHPPGEAGTGTEQLSGQA